MFANTFGILFRLTTYGESHGEQIGGIIDGCPAGIRFDMMDIQKALDKRSPSQEMHGIVSTARKEKDLLRIVSGVVRENGSIVTTLGTPIAFFVENEDSRKEEYLSTVYRPGHAEYTYHKKFGLFDGSGGGRASARETVSRVVGGAIAEQILRKYNIFIYVGTEEFAGIKGSTEGIENASKSTLYALDSKCIPHWISAIEEAREDGDTLGGVVRIEVHGVPAGLGEPVFDKLDARLAYALLSIGGVKGFESGSGFSCTSKKGSENNDPISQKMESNNAGGILGGISSGQPLVMRVAVKPISSISKEQNTMTIRGKETKIAIQGRHDCSAIPRILPVISAMVSLTLVDFILLQEGRVFKNVSRETS